MKAKETMYKGYNFRSRLEARWAVYFDTIGVKYEYEPQGFTFKDGTNYLPDFFLPDLDAYVEIKPIGAIKINFDHENNEVEFDDGRDNAYKYAIATYEMTMNGYSFIIFEGDPFDALIIDHGGKGSSNVFYMGKCIGGLMSMDNPNYTCASGQKCIDCGYRNKSMLCSNKIMMLTPNHIVISYSTWDSFQFVPDSDQFSIAIFSDDDMEILNDKDDAEKYLEINISAIRNSRQARFEHGETPYTGKKAV